MANMIFSEKSPITSLCQYVIYLFNLIVELSQINSNHDFKGFKQGKSQYITE